MLSINQIKEIRKLIEDGFDIELISVELDIPLDKLESIKNTIENSNKSYNVEPTSKMDFLRKRYQEKYVSKNVVNQDVKKDNLTSKYIQRLIGELDEGMQEIFTVPKGEIEMKELEIFKLINKTKKLNISLEDAEELYRLFDVEKLKSLKTNWVYKMGLKIKDARDILVRKVLIAIEEEANNTSDLQKLEELRKKVSLELISQNKIFATKIKDDINKKITALKKESKIGTAAKDANPEVSEIANKILKEEINIDEAVNELYKDTQTTEKELYIVMGNLINNAEYEKAEDLLNKGFKNDIQYKRIFKNKIKGAKIADSVKKGLNMKGTVSEENKYYEQLRNDIENANISLKSIDLGKNEDGTKNITLDDIWSNERVK